MAEYLRLVTTIRVVEARNRPIRCSVKKSNDNLARKRGTFNQKVYVDVSLMVDPELAAILWKLLNQSKTFSMHFTIWLYKTFEVKIGGTSARNVVYNKHLSLRVSNVNVRSVHTCSCLKTKASIHVMPSKVLNITADVRWSKKLWPLLVEFAQLNDVMSWLSTLGGAYSSLGENCVISSKKAGEISRQQYVIASKLNNPILTTQCNLFLAMSLVQRGHLRLAAIIIRQQYAQVVSNGLQDAKVISLCKAVWNKIQYKKQLKLQARRSRKSVGVIHQDCS